MSTLVVSRAELRRAMPFAPEHLDAIADGFVRLSRGEVEQPPILRVEVPEHNGELDVKSAYVRGWDSFALKLSSGFFDNPAKGLPSASGMMVVISAETGVPKAVLLDDGYLTELRTALAGGVAARAMAPERVRCAGVIGAGSQARWQLRALVAVRALPRVLLWARRREAAETAASELSAELNVPVSVSDGVEELVRSSDVVVSTTPSREPLVRAAWLHPGLHLTAMGSDAEGKRELEPAVLRAVDLVVGDRLSQNRRLGELQGLDADGEADVAAVELGEVLDGRVPGRTSPDEVTVADLTGTGVQDTVIARLALERATAMGMGREFGD